MIKEKTYYFAKVDYDSNGFNIKNGRLFLEYIAECENDFYNDSVIFFSNYFFANSSTMCLIKSCFNTEVNDDFGMDLIEGEINLDMNLTIEKHSKRKTTYAIGSNVKGNEDEPLFLIIDEEIKDGEFILKYISDNDDNDSDSNDGDLGMYICDDRKMRERKNI